MRSWLVKHPMEGNPLIDRPPTTTLIGAEPTAPDGLPAGADHYTDPDILPLTRPTAPTCPRCQSTMQLRTAKRGETVGSQFWGCPNYPKCRGTLPYVGGTSRPQ